MREEPWCGWKALRGGAYAGIQGRAGVCACQRLWCQGMGREQGQADLAGTASFTTSYHDTFIT